MKIIVLGAGLVGGAIAADLAEDKEFSVTACDINAAALKHLSEKYGINTVSCDLSKPENVKEVIAQYDLVVSAVPGFMGFSTLKSVIEAGKNVVDIAFFPEDAFALDEAAKEHNVTAIVDCGVAPGMSNILTGYAASMMDEVETAVTYVGGLPHIRQWPWEYRAVFSPIDVIEEYTRPARFIENGKLVIRPALSEPELIDFPGIGTLEAFNSDGLRTMIKTIKARNMKEKTLRYPGHREKMLLLREAGFFSSEPVEVSGKKVVPLELTAKLLFPKWKLNPGDHDLTVMQVKVEGMKNGRSCVYQYDLFDTYDTDQEIHSMARVTGFTAAMAARMISRGLYNRKGINPPEYIGREPECVKFIINGLAERGVNYKGLT